MKIGLLAVLFFYAVGCKRNAAAAAEVHLAAPLLAFALIALRIALIIATAAALALALLLAIVIIIFGTIDVVSVAADNPAAHLQSESLPQCFLAWYFQGLLILVFH